MAMVMPSGDGMARLQADDAYYCSMLELIPSKFYFHKDDDEKLQSTRFFKVRGKGLIEKGNRQASLC